MTAALVSGGRSSGKRQRRAARLVYFIQASRLRLIKIGSTSNLERRLALLRTGSPDHLDVVGLIQPPCAWSLEAELHARFWADRLQGEWFSPSPELVSYINQHAALRPDTAAQDAVDAGLTKAWAARGDAYVAPSRAPFLVTA